MYAPRRLSVLAALMLSQPTGFADRAAGPDSAAGTAPSVEDVLSFRDGCFHLDGRHFAEISFNKFDLFWQLYDQLASGRTLGDDNPLVAAQDRALADLRALGFRTIRVFALPWGPSGPPAYADPEKRKRLYAALDKMVELCERHGIGVVWSLSLGSFTDTRIEPGKGWTRGEEQLRELIADPESRGRKLAFRYLDETVARYRHRKAVVMWEVHNELTLAADIGDANGVYQGERVPTLDQVAAFLDAAAKRIKAADPLRLVNSGGSAPREHQWHLYQRAGWKLDTLGEQLKCFELLYARSALDVVDIHYYPGTNPGAMISDGKGGRTTLDLKGYMKIARQIGKPLMLGEFGLAPIARSDTNFWKGVTNYFESFADVKNAKPWVAGIVDDVVGAGVPLSYWWCYQSDRPMDQKDPQRMDIERKRNPELVELIVAANRRLKAKLLE